MRAVVVREFVRLDGDADEAVPRVPRARRALDAGRKRIFVLLAFDCLVIVAEVVDEFLNAHGLGRLHFFLADEAADVGIGRGVHVSGEGGERRGADGFEGVLDERGVGFATALDDWGLRVDRLPFARIAGFLIVKVVGLPP